MSTKSALEQRIGRHLTDMSESWNSKDAVAWASHFAEEADFINIYGGYHHGRGKIRESHDYLFTGIFKDSVMTLELEVLEVLSASKAVALVGCRLDGAMREVRDARMTMIFDGMDGTPSVRWFHNVAIVRPAHHGDHDRAASVNADYTTN